jgi:hypothetical protein
MLHFFLLAIGLFLLHGVTRQAVGGGEAGHIVVTRGQVEHLATGFTRTWQRPPTSEELVGLLRDRVREEVYYREALALGLDKEDTVIRRRLQQKMEFLNEDLAARAETSDAELTAYLQAHPDAFRVEPRFTFRHVYLDPRRRGADLARDADELLAAVRRLGDRADLAELGDATMLEPEVAAPLSQIAQQFGAKYAA